MSRKNPANNFAKKLDKWNCFGIINPAPAITGAIQRDCVRVARQTLTLFVRVRILLPLPYRSKRQGACSVFLQALIFSVSPSRISFVGKGGPLNPQGNSAANGHAGTGRGPVSGAAL